ncbi:MAG: CPBP family intramembrane metalloprotease [Gemmataceae bacterium]|nr:CPBP family intramembrane metalloprotease [Gemmataceae bacterium]
MDEPEKPPDPPWRGPELFAAFLLGQVVPALAFHGLDAAGAFDAMYGEDAAKTTDPVEQARLMLWAVCAAFPFQVLAVLGLLWQTARASPRSLGLTLDEARPSLRDAMLLALAIVPLCYGIQALCLWIAHLVGVPEVPHEFTRLAKRGMSGTEWGLLLFAACVRAPVWEELFFRGLVQRWVIGRGLDGEAVALAAAMGFAVLGRMDLIQKSGSTPELLTALAPALCALALCALHPLLPRGWRGLWASALLFAFVHSKVWPSPLALLPLALALGWLARRHGTLAGPILLHALFNAVACAFLLWP